MYLADIKHGPYFWTLLQRSAQDS